MPMIAVAAGMALFALPLGFDGPRPGADDDIAERLTELVVIVSLTGAGLKLTRRVGWRSWMTTWRLLAITMPITVAVIALLGVSVLGLPLAAAVLLGAVIAPTDPVLASEVQLADPDRAATPPKMTMPRPKQPIPSRTTTIPSGSH